jgi:glutamate racemase
VASTSPSAVLDTGAGGLSVVKAIRMLMPHEDIHYFADTAHLPYGIKSPELIRYLSVKMARKLQELSQCKVLILACHTISTLSLKEIEDALNIPVLGMTAPSILGLKRLVDEKPIGSVGVISTKATVLSRAYSDAWKSIDVKQERQLNEYAAGLLVSLVEEADAPISSLGLIVDQMLPDAIKTSDALLIGCTHFSALLPVLRKVLKPGCIIVDAANLAAEMIFSALKDRDELRISTHEGRLIAYVSDNPQRFQIIARRFIEDDLLVEWLRDYAQS